MNKTLLAKAKELVEPQITEMGLELFDVEYVKEGAHWYLRLYIDKEGGVDIDDCAAVSQKVSELLDKGNIIPQTYMLEVSSPGIERPLRKKEDYEKYKGELVSVHTSKEFEGYSRFTGILKGLIEDKAVLEYNGKEISIPIELIERAHLTFEF